ncbi:hypothetical protein ACLKA7_004905 [Drosophila subpalustris]
MATSITIAIAISNNDDDDGNGNGNGNYNGDDYEDDFNCDGVLMQQQASSYWNPFNSHNVTKRDWWQRQRRGKPYHMQRYLHNHAGAAACRSHGTGLQHANKMPENSKKWHTNTLPAYGPLLATCPSTNTGEQPSAAAAAAASAVAAAAAEVAAAAATTTTTTAAAAEAAIPAMAISLLSLWQLGHTRASASASAAAAAGSADAAAGSASATAAAAAARHQQQLKQQRLRRRRRRQQKQRQQAKNLNCHPYGIGDAASWRHIDAQLHPHPVGQQVSMQLNGSSCPSWAACCQIQNPLLDEQRHQSQHQQQQRHHQQLKQQQQQLKQKRPPWPIPYPMPTSLWPQRQSRVHMGALAVLLLLAITHLMPTMGVSTTINSASNPHLPYPWQRHHQQQQQQHELQQQQHQQAAVAEEEEAEQRRWTSAAAAAAAAVWRPSHGNWRQLAHRKTKKTKYT